MNFRKLLSKSLSITVFTIIAYVHAGAQLNNPCGVAAKIWPAATDSVVPVGTNLKLSSTSINATSVEWLIDGFRSGITTSIFNYWTETGTHKISLVARNGNCTDTTTVFYFSAGQPYNIDSSMFANYGLFNTFEYGTCMDATADGGFVLGGYGTLLNSRNCGRQGLVVKLRDRGCVDWSIAIKDTISYCGYGDVNKIYASTFDSSYYVSGTGFLMKLDKNGNKVWNNIYRLNNWSYINPIRMTGDDQGNVYMLHGSLGWGWAVTKINTAGHVLWNKSYLTAYSTDPSRPNFSNAFGLTYLNGKIYVTGGNMQYISATTTSYYDCLTKIDAATGKTEWQYRFENPTLPGSRSFDQVSNYDTLVMVAGGGQGQGVYLIDPQGNLVKSMKAKLGSSYAPHITKAVADKKGGIYIMQWTEATLNLQPYYYYYTNFVKIDTALNKYWGLIYPKWNFNDIAMSKNDFGAVGSDFGKEASAFWGSVDMRFLKVNTGFDNTNKYSNSTSCNYYTDDFILSTIPMNRSNFNWGVDTMLSIEPTPVTSYIVQDAHIQSRYTCTDFVDSCSFMNISGPSSGCSYNSTYTYYIHRNKKCSLVPAWKLPKGVSIVAQTDSSLTVQFPGFGVYGIGCALKSCTPAFDSLTVTIKSKTAKLDLGRDTVICDQTAITLRAGKQFLSYQWQDGSTDSVFTVTRPGSYWVQVYDSCGNPLRDTITISAYANPSFTIGPDRKKCNGDTLHLSVPSGFLNYTWSNNYNISSTNSRSVVINPLVDTAYYIKAEKIPGCFVYDTVRITVHQSPTINLGANRSFCSGDSAVFHAGIGFSKYQWSNSATTAQIAVKTAGSYSVMAETTQGCKSYDTVKVLNVFANPVIRLDQNSNLCAGVTRLLDAGLFSSYLWNDGISSRTHAISGTGVYAVEVTDNNGCKGNDTTSITKILPPPSGFLPADTSICSYGSLTLSADKPYKSYLWSTNATSPSLSISKAGLYWLQVKDAYDCIGKDTILISPKDCMNGLYVPTAFTPNGDGKNDLFRPMLFGNVKNYRFTVYNRWGQIVFQTTELNKGWNGINASLPQDHNVFVWSCTYQLEGETLKVEKGTVLLVR